MIRSVNEALMRRYMDAWQADDIETVMDCYSDDVVMIIQGRSRHAGTTRGKAEFSAAIGRIVGDSESAEIVEIHDVLVSDDHAVGLVRERFCSGGRCVDTDRVVVYELRAGKIAEIRTYDSDVYAYDGLYPVNAR